VAGNVLEQLVAEWYDYKGYFIRRNIKIAKIERGSHAELDIMGFHPKKKLLIHVEASVSKIDEATYAKKFELGRRYVSRVFDGFDVPSEIDQIALTTVDSEKNRVVLPAGRVMLVREFYEEIFRELKLIRIANDSIPEEYPILRSLHYVACPEYVESMCRVLCE
jgi:hypothetical protein